MNVAGDRARRVLIVAAEPSGDAQASRLARALLDLRPEGLDLYGITGPQMRAAGVASIGDIAELSVMGFSEVVAGLGRVASVFRRLRREIRSQPGPDLVVHVDAPDFNIPLSGVARRAGRRALYYVSPQVWAWRVGRIAKLARRIDRMLVLFPFEEAIYREHGIDAHFIGHPLAADVRPSDDRATVRARYGIGDDERMVALLPGSRGKEVRVLLPPMLEAASRLAGKARFVIAKAPSVGEDLIASLTAGSGVPVIVADDDTYNVVAAADAAAVTSGTATVETALLGCPFVAVYRMSRMSHAIAKRLVKVDHIAMPNIILGERVVPELVQDELDGASLARELEPYLDDDSHRGAVAAKLAEVSALIAREDADRRAAELTLELLP